MEILTKNYPSFVRIFKVMFLCIIIMKINTTLLNFQSKVNKSTLNNKCVDKGLL